jgi:elongation factor 1-beta
VKLIKRIKMAKAVVTLKIMPDSPETDLKALENKSLKAIKHFCGDGKEVDYRTEIEPIAFGLKAVKLTFVMDEAKGSTEKLENEISGFEEVNSVEVIDVRRAIG